MKIPSITNPALSPSKASSPNSSVAGLESQQIPPRQLAEALNQHLSEVARGPISAEDLAKLRKDTAASMNAGPAEAEAAIARTMVTYNLNEVARPEDARAIADQLFAAQPVRTELAGYSNPALEKASGYDYTALLEGMASEGKGKQAFVSSATCEGIDGKVHEVSQATKTPELAITAKQYLGYIDPSNLSESTNRDQFAVMPKFYCDTDHDYHRATAQASTGLLVAGGGDVAGQNFKEHVLLGRPIALVDDGQGPKLNHQINRLRSDNASAWLADKLGRFEKGQPMLEHGGKAYDLNDVLARGDAALRTAKGLVLPSGEAADNAAKSEALAAALQKLGIPVEVYTDAKMFEKTGVTADFLAQNSTSLAKVKVFSLGDNEDQREVGAAAHRHLAGSQGAPSL